LKAGARFFWEDIPGNLRMPVPDSKAFSLSGVVSRKWLLFCCAILATTRRAAVLFDFHFVARSLQTKTGLLVACASWKSKIPCGKTPAIYETLH
jgi:hypothetical protein